MSHTDATAEMLNQMRADAEQSARLARIATNLSHGIYGNRSEVHTLVTRELSEPQRVFFYSLPEVREELAELPEDAFAELLADMEAGNGFAFAYRN